MLSFFEALIEYFDLAWNVFLNFLNSLLGILVVVFGVNSSPAMIAGYMWGPIGTCVVSVWALSVVKFILGRSNI